MRVFGLIALVAAIGCGGPDSEVNGVFPANGFLGRDMRVQISGDGTEWSNGATVNFGNGITVNAVEAASPGALFADITISDTAEIGPHDVVVSDDGTNTLLAAFDVTSPIEITITGNAAQGSIASFNIKNLDLSNPFDDTDLGSIFGSDFVNLELLGPLGTDMAVQQASAFAISGTILIDVDAASGPVTLSSGPMGGTIITSTFPELAIEPRAAVPLTANVATPGNAGELGDSQLYEFTPGAAVPSAMTLFASTTDPEGFPTLAILGSSGTWQDLISADAFGGQLFTGAPGEKIYIVVFDGAAAGYAYDLTAVQTGMLTGVAESEPQDTANQADAAALTNLITGATLADDTDEDWYRIPIATGDIGKRVHVVTGGADPLTDTVVDIFRNTDEAANLIGTVSDSGFHETCVSIPIPAGTTSVLVKISASSFFDVEHLDYEAAIYVQ